MFSERLKANVGGSEVVGSGFVTPRPQIQAKKIDEMYSFVKGKKLAMPLPITLETREEKALFARYDPDEMHWVLKSLGEINGRVPKRQPESIARDQDDMVVIQVGRPWLLRNTPLILMIRGLYPSCGRLVFTPWGFPNRFFTMARESWLRKSCYPWDLSRV